jgi:hypothetical protein
MVKNPSPATVLSKVQTLNIFLIRIKKKSMDANVFLVYEDSGPL